MYGRLGLFCWIYSQRQLIRTEPSVLLEDIKHGLTTYVEDLSNVYF